METPRSLGLATPRASSVRPGMRGTVASVAWPEDARDVPWLIMTCRMTGQQWLYGERSDDAHEETTFSLRRGEYIRSISGGRIEPPCSSETPALARFLRITTSEQQEIVAGQASAEIDFSYEADEGHEITALTTQSGVICGVKQAVLAPSRVPGATANHAGGASAPTGGGAQVALGALAAQRSTQLRPDAAELARSIASGRQKSLDVLRRGAFSRVREAAD